MIDINRKLKNFGPLEVLVLSSITYVIVMLLWTASTRSEVLQKANDIKSNHKSVVDFINDEVNSCSSNEEGSTSWGEKCNSVWSSDKIVNYVLNNIDLKNPYSIKNMMKLLQTILSFLCALLRPQLYCLRSLLKHLNIKSSYLSIRIVSHI